MNPKMMFQPETRSNTEQKRMDKFKTPELKRGRYKLGTRRMTDLSIAAVHGDSKRSRRRHRRA